MQTDSKEGSNKEYMYWTAGVLAIVVLLAIYIGIS
jgi:hypothetical protein